MINELKIKLMKMDYVLVGTLLKSYKQCGKANCRCMIKGEAGHGPYYILTRKYKGKTITKSLTHQQAILCKRAIKNMAKLNRYLEKWKSSSLQYIACFVKK